MGVAGLPLASDSQLLMLCRLTFTLVPGEYVNMGRICMMNSLHGDSTLGCLPLLVGFHQTQLHSGEQ